MIILWHENAVIYSAEYTDKKALTLIEHTYIMAILIFPWKGKLRPELNTSLYRCEFLSTSIHVKDGQMTEIISVIWPNKNTSRMSHRGGVPFEYLQALRKRFTAMHVLLLRYVPS